MFKPSRNPYPGATLPYICTACLETLSRRPTTCRTLQIGAFQARAYAANPKSKRRSSGRGKQTPKARGKSDDYNTLLRDALDLLKQIQARQEVGDAPGTVSENKAVTSTSDTEQAAQALPDQADAHLTDGQATGTRLAESVGTPPPGLFESALKLLKATLSGQATQQEKASGEPPKPSKSTKQEKGVKKGIDFHRAPIPEAPKQEKGVKKGPDSHGAPIPEAPNDKSGNAFRKLPKTVPNTIDRIAPQAAKQAVTTRTRKRGVLTEIGFANPRQLVLEPIEKQQPPVPRLSYGLDRVLFNPGVYNLQDPRSRVYNFDPYLASIMPIEEFDFNALKQYITSSKDKALISIAQEYGKKYSGSTSSMTSMLGHFHYLLSAWRPVQPAYTSSVFRPESTNFTRINRGPAVVFLHHTDGRYAIDADKEFDTANVLSMLGKSMEKLLTLPKEEYEKYRRGNSEQLTEEERNGAESYHYTTMGDFMMRSQLDAHHPRVPGTGMFDLKTRAVVSIRMDAKDFHKGLGYEIRSRVGQWESFEREYYDMIRSAFLKYSLQVRMGRMDGIFVAFHNVERIFGFQYISLNEMDRALHGSHDTLIGDAEFKLSLNLLNKVLDKATAKYPGQSLRLYFETRPANPPFMYIFAKPVTPAEIEQVQNTNRAAVEAFESEMMGIVREDEGGEAAMAATEIPVELDDLPEEDVVEAGKTSMDVWEDLLDNVQDALENDELGVAFVRQAIEYAVGKFDVPAPLSAQEMQQNIDALLDAVVSTAAASGPTAKAAPAPAGMPDGGEETRNQSPTSEDGSSQSSSSGPQNTVATAPADEASPGGSRTEDTSMPTRQALTGLVSRLLTQLQTAPLEGPDEVIEAQKPGDQEISSDWSKLVQFERIVRGMRSKSSQGSVVYSGDGGHPPTTSTGPDNTSQRAAAPPALPGRLDRAAPVEEAPAGTSKPGDTKHDEDWPAVGAEEDLFGMILTIRNKVNGAYVARPDNFTKQSSWVVEYAIDEIASPRVHTLYNQIKRRREALHSPKLTASRDDQWYKMYRGKLHQLSQRGRSFRKREIQRAKRHGVYVYGMDEPLKFESVFGKDGKGASHPEEA